MRARTALRIVGRIALAATIILSAFFVYVVGSLFYQAEVVSPEDQARITQLEKVVAKNCQIGSSIDCCITELARDKFYVKREDLPCNQFDRSSPGDGHSAFIQLEAKGDRVSFAKVGTAALGIP